MCLFLQAHIRFIIGPPGIGFVVTGFYYHLNVHSRAIRAPGSVQADTAGTARKVFCDIKIQNHDLCSG